MYGSWGSSSSSSAWGSWLTNKDTSSNTNAGDIYWDVWGNRTWATPMDFSNASSTIDESKLKFWTNAHAEQAKSKDYLANRNNEIASYLYALNKDKWGEVDRIAVKWYLDKFKDFTDAEEWEQNNTIDAILARYGEVKKEKEKTDTWVTWIDEKSLNDINWDWKSDKEWFYLENWEYIKAYWYEGLSDEYKNLFDRLPDNKKKERSNLWAQELQRVLKEWDASMREKEQAEARWKLTDDLHNIEKESWQIQADQTIRNAEQSYENLKQNWQYLWNMGMPGTSATKIQAIGDALTEARTTLEEVKRLTNLKSDAQAKQWDAQVLNYSQQIDNLMYDLRWKIGQEAIDALSKYTTAELEWKLDTIDWVTAFRREILDELDTNLSGITAASLTQMQYINKEYQDIADKMYEYSKNANVVNKDMSSVLWYYVDGNGNAIINAEWKPIQVPPTAPIDPVFDKETGKLITFATDDNWNIVASVQQVWSNPTSLPSWYSGWSWSWVASMRTERNNNPTAMTSDVARSLWWVEGVDYEVWDSWTNSKGQTYYTARLIGDPIQKTIELLDRAAESWRWAFYTKAGWQRWTYTAMSDAQWLALDYDEKVNKVLDMLKHEWGNINNMSYYVDSKNAQLNENGYKDNDTANYDIYLSKWYKAFTDADKERIAQEYWTIENFRTAAENYRKALSNKVSDNTINLLKTLYNVKKMGRLDFMNAWMWVAGTDWYKYRVDIDNIISSNTLQKLIDMKAEGATFWALSDGELDLLKSAATKLDYKLAYWDFKDNVDDLISDMEQKLRAKWYDVSKIKEWASGNWWWTEEVEIEEEIPEWNL